MGKALEALDLDHSYAIITMGINNSFFSETEGFNCDDSNQYLYGKSKVYQIPAPDSSIVIMKENELPFFKSRNDNEGLDGDMQLLDRDTNLYSNIDKLSDKLRILKVAQCYNLYVPKKLRYIRIKISYNLTSDLMLLNKIQPINKYFGL